MSYEPEGGDTDSACTLYCQCCTVAEALKVLPNGQRPATCCQEFADDQTAQADSIKRRGPREIRDIPEAITTLLL